MSESVTPEVRAEVARSVLKRNMGVRPGERVIIEGWTHTLPWAVAFAREARRMKALPLIPYEDEAAYWDAVDHGEDKVLGAAPAHEWAALGRTNVYLHMWGPGDRVRMGQLPESRQERLTGFNNDWYDSAHKAKLRGARMELGRPYPTLAKVYGVDLDTWSDQIIRATKVDPERLRKSAQPIVRALSRGKRLRIRDDHGTDVTLGLAHRKPRVHWGRPDAEASASRFGMLIGLPAGSVRVALDESVAEGEFVANRSSYYEDGTTRGGHFTFRSGKLVDASFASGGERFEAGFAKGGKGRDMPGMFSLGLNPELHDTPQVEDLERGAVLVSVGTNRNLGGKNPSGFFGFAVTAGARIEVDGRPLSPGR